ncbi:DUF523 domain-containing protein, partial [Mycobacterium tuberculosis]|nr:DUF523 domain-containing protein [Mycobacterium tuberculosis]
YDGRGRPLASEHLERWRAGGRLVAFCPEVAAGLPTPRPPAEIGAGGDGRAVLAGAGRVLTSDGDDVSAAFRGGAELALPLARAQGCRFA